MRTTSLLLATLALTACAGSGLSDERHPTGSSSLAAASDYNRVYVANSDNGTVSILDRAGERMDMVDVGIDPVRLARAGDLVFVTTRGEGSVAILEESGKTLVMKDSIQVGPDPYGVVASEDGSRVFVAVGMADEVVEIDVASREIVARFSVPGQPRWLGLHPSGKSLYVGSAFGGTWSHVDLEEAVVTSFTPPERIRHLFDQMDGSESIVSLTPRITGDIGVSPDGDFIVVPVFYVDNTTPVEGDEDGPAPNSGYASGPGVGRTNPSILIVGTGSDGGPEGGSERTLFAQAPRFTDGVGSREFDEFGDPNVLNARSYISSATVSPDGLTVLATMEGSQTIVTLPIDGNVNSKGRFETDFMEDFESGFEFVQGIAIETGVGPRGVAFLRSDEAVVDSWLERSLETVPYGDARATLRQGIVGGGFFADPGQALEVISSVETAPAVLEPAEEAGRKLFYSATDSAMAAHSGGISCATCHYDGRNDGLTWTFAAGERQTPSLAGVVSETTPVTWTNNVPSVATEVRLTSRDRMGGSGASVNQSKDVQAYIDLTPYPATRRMDLDEAAVDRGRDLFFGEAACADCHNGAAYTDTVAYDMFGLDQVMTPALRGIAATAPYLHDGRAANLRELVEVAEDGGMGKTNHLTSEQKDDLALFLSTL